MTYRFLEPDELLEEWDEYFIEFSADGIWASINKSNIGKRADIYYKYTVRRPVPEPRPVEELTEDEREELISLYNTFYEKDDWDAISDGLLEMIKRSDEIRSKPRETPKEKWEKKAIKEFYEHGNIEAIISETWDAAYEQGRKSG